MTDTQKGTVSVSRELLERLSLPMQSTPAYLLDHRDALDELRAILAQPAEQWDEPVAWLVQAKASGYVEQAAPDEKATNPQYWTDAFPVYRRPAAQAVKLPMKCSEQTRTRRGFDFAQGWNESREATARLNGIEP